MIAFIVCLGVTVLLQWLTPFWWWVGVVPFVVGAAIPGRARGGLAFGAAAPGLLWLAAGLFFWRFTGHCTNG